MSRLRVVELGAIVREDVLGERRDGGRGVAQGIAEALGRAGQPRSRRARSQSRARERLAGIGGLPLRPPESPAATPCSCARARGDAASGLAELIDVAPCARRAARRRRRRPRARPSASRASAARTSGRSSPHSAERRVDGLGDLDASGTSAASSAVSQSATSIAGLLRRAATSAIASPSPSTAIQPSSGTSSSSSSSSSAGGPSAHRYTIPWSNGSATRTPTTASPDAANGFAASRAASS